MENVKKEQKTLMVQACPLSLVSYKVENARGVFLLVHGMCEHKERYFEFMESLADSGYSSYIFDLRGHGESVSSKYDYGYIGNDKYDTLVEDVHQILGLVKTENPDKKVIMFAHSMGSLIARVFLKKYDNEIDALILSGAPYSRGGASAGSAIVSILGKTKGGHEHSPLIDNLAMGGYSKSFDAEGRNAWISSDETVVEAYDLDPKCAFRFTINGYAHLLSLQKEAFAKRGWEMKNAALPILFIAGTDDPCAGSMKNFRSSVMALRNIGYENVKWKRYEGCRHEVLNDVKREEAIKDVLRFTACI